MTVVGIGRCTLEHIGIVDRPPKPGAEVEMHPFSTQGGGPVATATVLMSNWGLDSSFVGKIGDDHNGETIERSLTEEGVDTEGMAVEPDAVSRLRFNILEGEGKRASRLSSRGTVEPLSTSDVDFDAGASAELLVIDGLEPTVQLEAAEVAGDNGVDVVLDAADLDPEHDRLVERSDYLVATERFASRFTGVGELDRLCRALLEAGPKAVAIKLGKEGVVGLSEGEGGLVRRDGPTVDVCDSTGEGDVFLGAFSYAVATDRGFADALQLANVASSLSNRGLGARGALPTLDEVQKWTE